MSRSDDLAAVIRDAAVTGTGNSVVVVGGEPGRPKSLTADGKPFNPMFWSVPSIADLERENAELRAALLRYGPAAVDVRRAIGPLTEDELVEMQTRFPARVRLSASWEALGDVAAPVPVEAPPFPSRALRQRVGQAIGLIER